MLNNLLCIDNDKQQKNNVNIPKHPKTGTKNRHVGFPLTVEVKISTTYAKAGLNIAKFLPKFKLNNRKHFNKFDV